MNVWICSGIALVVGVLIGAAWIAYRFGDLLNRS